MTRATGAKRVSFTPIDEMVEILDSEIAPWSIQLEVRVSGRLDEERLRKALQQALGRHPMGRARKVPVSEFSRQSQWEIAPELDLDPLRTIEINDDGDLARARADLYSLSVGLSESPPLRVRLARHVGGDYVMFNVNHTAFDGFGTARIALSVARAYSGRDDPGPDIDSSRMRDPSSIGGRGTSRDVAGQARLLVDKLRDLIGAPTRIAEQGGADLPGYGFHHARLSHEQTRALVSNKWGDATVNDVLIAALNAAIARWNERHGLAARRIGVLMPVNLLPTASRKQLVGNYSVPVRVVTKPRDHSTLAGLLGAVAVQTTRIKGNGSAEILAELLSRPAHLPRWAKRTLPALLWLTGNRLVDTAMLSNLGHVDELPDFGPDAGETVEFWFSPPARMPLGVAVGTVTACDRLHLVFRYRRALFDADAAAEFARAYLSALEALA